MAIRAVDGILIPFTGKKDKKGTFWDAKSDFALDMFGPQPVLLYHGVFGDHTRVGRVVAAEVREAGLWIRAEIDDAMAGLADFIASGKAAWSSGTAPHLMDVAEDGYVKRWPLVEASLVHSEHAVASEGLTSANYVRVGEAADAFRSDILAMPPWSGALAAPTQWFKTEEQFAASSTTMDVKHRQGNAQAWMFGDPLKALPAGGTPVIPEAEHIRVASEFDSLSTLGLAFCMNIGKVSGERAFRALGNRVIDAYNKHDGDFHIRYDPASRGKVELMDDREIDYKVVDAMRKFAPHLRTNELMASDSSGNGGNFVATVLGQQVYHWAQLHTRIAPLMTNFDMPSQPYDFPTVTSGPTFHAVAETDDQARMTVSNAMTPPSKIGTGTIRFTAGKLSALTLESEELVEDSIPDVLAAIAEEYTRALAYELDYVLINGDTTAGSGNVNSNGANPAAGTNYLSFDGIRNTADSNKLAAVDHPLAANDLLPLLQILGRRGIFGRDLANVVLVTSPEGAYRLDGLDDYLTMDKVGDKATLLRGQVGAWMGVPVIVTEAVPADVDNVARVNTVASNNNRDLMLLIHRPTCRVGWRRRPMMEVERVAGTDSRFIYASLRASWNQLEGKAVAAMPIDRS